MSYCIYLRKSRADAEAEMRGEGETLARHEKALTEFARQAKMNVTKIYREIISGETIAARPAMQELLSEVSAGSWDGVIVMDIDRLARGNSIDQGIIAQTFLFANTKIITPAKTYDPSNEFDEEYFEFGLFMSRREYKTINRRLQRGRNASVKEGKYVSNKAPYGYERVKIAGDKGFTLSVIPEQAEVIKNIFEWYTSGRMRSDGTTERIGVSLIARELNSLKIKPPSGDFWASSTIRDILINPVYIGKIRWNWRPVKKQMRNGQIVIERPRSHDYLLCDGLHEPIVSEEIFRLAETFMRSNKKRPIRGDRFTQNPLASLVVCQKCGRKMQRRPNSKNPDMLICPAPTCGNHSSYLHLVENRVMKVLNDWANGYILTTNKKRISENNTDAYESELSAIMMSEAKIRARLNKVYEAFETGVYDIPTFQQRNNSLQQELNEIEKKKEELQKSIRQMTENRKILSEFIPKTRQIVELYDSVSDDQSKNNMLKEIIRRIDYIKLTRGHGHEEDFELTVYPKLPEV